MNESVSSRFNSVFFLVFLASFWFFASASISYSAQSINLEIVVPDTYKQVKPGNEFWFTTNLLNMNSSGRQDITIKYEFVNPAMSVIASKSETVAVETQSSFVSSIHVPPDSRPGSYVLRATVVSLDWIKSSEVSISVHEDRHYSFLYYVLALVVMLVLFLVFFSRARRLIYMMELKAKIKRIVNARLGKNVRNDKR